jgi:DNA polymerase-3 subunit delta'
MISGNHPDIRIFDDDQQALKIDQIRELQRELSLSPVEGDYRVAVLANFERATTSAANALLKTLEEPTPQVVLILTAPDPAALLPTIVSRCQMLTLRPLSPMVVSAALQQQWQVTPSQAELLTQLSRGCLGWAVRTLTDETYLGRRTQLYLDLLQVLGMHRAERLNYAYNISRDVLVQRETLILWLSIWRDLLLLRSGSQTKIINLDWLESLQNLALCSTVAQITEAIGRLQAALFNLDRNVNARLNIEVLLLKLPRYSNVVLQQLG